MFAPRVLLSKIFQVTALMYCCLLCCHTFAHNEPTDAQEASKALAIFEKAVLLSPSLLAPIKNSAVTPFYKVGQHKIYLNEGFWELTRAWIRLYQKEIEKHCPCDVDPGLLTQEAKNYLAQGLMTQKVLNPGQKLGTEISYFGAHITAKYGYVLAAFKLTAEVAETVLSVFMGIKGIHILCSSIDAFIIPLVRGLQKYSRTFLYGRQLNSSGSITMLKVAWFSRQIRKGKRQVFFQINQALEFQETELERVGAEGPRSLFKRRGHRLLWLEKLKTKTDPLFERLKHLEQELENETLSHKVAQIKKEQDKIQKRIENISKVNRKEFFGMRFKRFLLLYSRKGYTTRMAGNKTPDKIMGRDILWPLSLQENVLEKVLNTPTTQENKKPYIKKDLIRDGLIEEFLSKTTANTEEGKEVLRFFLADIEKIFDTHLSRQERLARVYALEVTLGALFAKYLSLAAKVFSNKYEMSFKEKLKVQWILGRFSYLVYGFSDFLASVAIIKKEEKINDYKYESMEKLLAFFDYLQEVQNLLKENKGGSLALFEKLANKQHAIKTISLSREKRTSFSAIPFQKTAPMCNKLVRMYQ